MVFLFLFLSLIIAVLQASLFTPIFGNLFLTPSLSFVFILMSSRILKEKSLIPAFITGMLLDTITDSLGLITLVNIVFLYIYLLITEFIFVKNKLLDFFIIPPLLLILRKIVIISIIGKKFLIYLSFKSFLLSFLIEIVFLVILYKLFFKGVNEEA